MNILILGSGGREHALAWKLSKSSVAPSLFMAPGNAGTSEMGENVKLDPLDFNAVGDFCKEKKIGIVVVGPEAPLVAGIYDFFKRDPNLSHIIITGPGKEGAQLEGSKAFAKSFMIRHGIPTAAFREFTSENFEEGINYINKHPMPVVLKADGLAGGKGVLICNNAEEAIEGFTSMIQEEKFGDSGKRVVIEQFLKGTELSVFVCTDGSHFIMLPEAKDYKKIGEGDLGLNTGGMGAISPVPFATEFFMQKVRQRIIEPTVKGLAADGIDYKGFIFFGLIEVDGEPYVLEYNCRLGDPETEVVLLRLKNDLIEILEAMDAGKLNEIKPQFSEQAALTMVAVSGGYPEAYEKGKVIRFDYLQNPMEIKHLTENGGVIVFHAGTRKIGNQIVTDGGRVLAVSSLTSALGESLELSEEILDQIHFEGKYFRSDIGFEFLD